MYINVETHTVDVQGQFTYKNFLCTFYSSLIMNGLLWEAIGIPKMYETFHIFSASLGIFVFCCFIDGDGDD